MATGICSTALGEAGQPTASAALLGVAVVCLVALVGALGWRLIRYPRRVLADLSAPDRAFAFFTIVAACNVLAVRLAGDAPHGRHRTRHRPLWRPATSWRPPDGPMVPPTGDLGPCPPRPARTGFRRASVPRKGATR